MVEVSKGVTDEEEVVRILYGLGVDQIKGDVR
jgi:hypothetical protein